MPDLLCISFLSEQLLMKNISGEETEKSMFYLCFPEEESVVDVFNLAEFQHVFLDHKIFGATGNVVESVHNYPV